MIFNHSITEFWISYESIMDSLEILFLVFLLQLVNIPCLPPSYHIGVREGVLS